MALSPGTTLGHYDILAAIGKGGMGEVWRARDTTLGRDVAIKTLPEEFAQDADRLARFEREAKLLASLNHPNIAAIYGLEEEHGTRFLVLELVEGDTLADRLLRGAIPADEALKLALQIAEALEAAHEKGVIHRDLKPANIKVTDAGTVKVLDFGLAKAFTGDAADVSVSNSPTLSMAATQAGMILGTAAYMSPEQAKGRATDRRTDIWAFGAVLYEMLTGRQSFGASDVSEALAAVIRAEPDWKHLPTDLHPRLKEILHRCLAKDLRTRFRDIGDVRVDIERVLADPSGVLVQAAAPVAQAAPQPRLAWILATGFGAATVLLGAVSLTPAPLPQVTRFEIHAPPGSALPMGTPAISADGRTFAYTVIDPDGVTRIHLRAIDRVDTQVLPGTEGGLHPFWSPDGTALAFAAADPARPQLKQIRVNGGLPRDVAEVGGPWHGTWNRRGDILFTTESSEIHRVSAEGGSVTPVTSVAEEDDVRGATYPEFLSDGERFLLRVVAEDGRSSIQLGALGSTERTIVLDDVASAPILAPTPGGKTYLLFMREPDLMVQEFDEVSGTVRGPAVVLVTDVGVVANPPVRPAVGVSRGGVLAYQARGADDEQFGNLVWLDRSGMELRTFPPAASLRQPRLSPDQSAVVGYQLRSGNRDVWVMDLNRESTTRITFPQPFDHFAVWSPDATRLAYRAAEDPDGVFLVDLNSGERQMLGEGGNFRPSSWSPDGQYLLADTPEGMFLLSVNGDQDPVEVGSRNGNSKEGLFSPDGRHIAFVSDESGRDEVYVRPMPPGTGQVKVSVNGGQQPRWRGDGRELFFVSLDRTMTVVDIDRGDVFSAGIPQDLFPYRGLEYDVSADGQRFLAYTPSGVGSTAGSPIIVEQNWWVALEERMAGR